MKFKALWNVILYSLVETTLFRRNALPPSEQQTCSTTLKMEVVLFSETVNLYQAERQSS